MGALSLLGSPLGRAASTLVRRPYLQQTNRDSASILWATLDAGDGRVVVGAPGGTYTVPAVRQALLPAQTNLPYPYYQYQSDLRGLDPGTEYAYRITLNGATL